MSPSTRSSQLCCSDPESPKLTMSQEVLTLLVYAQQAISNAM